MPERAADSSGRSSDAFEVADGDFVEARLGVEEGTEELTGRFDKGEEVAGLAGLVRTSDAENFHRWQGAFGHAVTKKDARHTDTFLSNCQLLAE